MKTARQLTVEALCRMEKEEAWSSLALDSVLKNTKLSVQDRGFASALFYDALARRYTIDACISSLSNRPISKLDLAVKNILRIGILQLLYLDSVPDHAAVDECVELARKMKKASAVGFINAVLRGFLRTNKLVPQPKKHGKAEKWALEYSCPPQLVNYWLKAYGEENTKKILENSLKAPTTFLRVNPLKITPEELLEKLAEKGVEAKAHPTVPNCLITIGQGAINDLDEYKQGLFHIQDISSQKAVLSLGAKQNERILDCCAAPGGKTFVIAEEMNGTGEVVACDIYPHRTEEIKSRNKSLELSNITTYSLDMNQAHPELGEFDRVICDAPCSGFGTIRRRPEIKYNQLDEFKDLPQLQLSLLENAGKYCKKGGILVYSTCTLSTKENGKVVEKFLQNNPQFQPADGMRLINNCWENTILIGEDEGDGFYIAVMTKAGS